MAKLTSINLPKATDKKSRKNIPTVNVVTEEGDVVKRYNEAYDAAEQAEADMKALVPILRKAGLEAVFNANCQATTVEERISSVNLVDVKMGIPETEQEPNGETLMLTWTKKDVKCDDKQVNATFDGLITLANKKANVNNYVRWMPQAKFDESAFVVNGCYDEKRFKAFFDAVGKVAQRLGIDNPLSCASVLKPVPEFHESLRWQQFDADANLKIHEVLPTQVNLKPNRPDAEK